MSATMRWRTTSRWPRWTKATPSMPPRMGSRPASPERPPGTSTWVVSPVTTAMEPNPDPGEEHLHLLGRGVLGLVEDDERRVERSAPHEGQRRHLHRAAVEQGGGPLGADHVVEGVPQRPEVGVDLGHQVAGEEAQPLAGLDRRAGEDDAVHPLGLEGIHGHGHGQPRLAGAGRAQPEGDDVVPDGVHVALLAGRLGAHGPAAGPAGPPRWPAPRRGARRRRPCRWPAAPRRARAPGRTAGARSAPRRRARPAPRRRPTR